MSVRFQNEGWGFQYGFALVPLGTFVKFPYTKHEVEVEMVFQN